MANPFDKTLPGRLGQPVGVAGKRVASPSRSLVFILDVSGSMEDEVEGGGETRLDAAKVGVGTGVEASTDGWVAGVCVDDVWASVAVCSVDVPIAFTNDPPTGGVLCVGAVAQWGNAVGGGVTSGGAFGAGYGVE